MLKKITSAILILAMLAFVGVLPGCGDDIETHEQLEIKDQPIHQETVVD